MTPDLLHHLTEREQLLHQTDVRRDMTLAAALLADDFREFGASGRVYDKAAILALLASEPAASGPITSGSYHLAQLGPAAALLTYNAIRSGVTTLRSSVWVLREDRWQILFHQGTKSSAP